MPRSTRPQSALPPLPPPPHAATPGSRAVCAAAVAAALWQARRALTTPAAQQAGITPTAPIRRGIARATTAAAVVLASSAQQSSGRAAPVARGGALTPGAAAWLRRLLRRLALWVQRPRTLLLLASAAAAVLYVGQRLHADVYKEDSDDDFSDAESDADDGEPDADARRGDTWPRPGAGGEAEASGRGSQGSNMDERRYTSPSPSLLPSPSPSPSQSQRDSPGGARGDNSRSPERLTSSPPASGTSPTPLSGNRRLIRKKSSRVFERSRGKTRQQLAPGYGGFIGGQDRHEGHGVGDDTMRRTPSLALLDERTYKWQRRAARVSKRLKGKFRGRRGSDGDEEAGEGRGGANTPDGSTDDAGGGDEDATVAKWSSMRRQKSKWQPPTLWSSLLDWESPHGWGLVRELGSALVGVPLDRLWVKIGYHNSPHHFNQGWGDIDACRRAYGALRIDDPPQIKVTWVGPWRRNGAGGTPEDLVWVRDATFMSPMALPESPLSSHLCEKSQLVHAVFTAPATWEPVPEDDGGGGGGSGARVVMGLRRCIGAAAAHPSGRSHGGDRSGAARGFTGDPRPFPVSIHHACSGDWGPQMRLAKLAIPLAARYGVGSIIPENCFYGSRRPEEAQLEAAGFSDHTALMPSVATLLAMGHATVQEGRGLVQWLRTDVEAGFGDDARLCLSGMSLGGCMCLYAKALCQFPVACVPLLAAHSAEHAWTRGALSRVADWAALARERGYNGPDALDRARRDMRQVLSDTVDITVYPPPLAPRAVIAVAAAHDAYIPARSSHRIAELWRGAEVRWVSGGHVTAFIKSHTPYHEAIVDALRRLDTHA